MRSKAGLALKLGQLIKYYKRKVFMKKYDENVHWKLVPDLYWIFRNNLEYCRCIQKSLANKIFGKKIIKILKKIWLQFFRTQSLYMDIVIRKHNEPGTSCQSLFRLQNMFKFFLYLVIHHLANFDALIHKTIRKDE